MRAPGTLELNPDRASRGDSSINIECALNLGAGSAVPPAGSADPPFASARYSSEYLPPYQPRYGKCTLRDIVQRANSSKESFCSTGTEPRSAGDTLQSSQNCSLGVRSDLIWKGRFPPQKGGSVWCRGMGRRESAGTVGHVVSRSQRWAPQILLGDVALTPTPGRTTRGPSSQAWEKGQQVKVRELRL